jgi:hypothetical protein
MRVLFHLLVYFGVPRGGGGTGLLKRRKVEGEEEECVLSVKALELHVLFESFFIALNTTVAVYN